MALPLMVLYEIGIGISRRILRQQDAEFNDPAPSGDKKAAPKKKTDKKVTGDPESGAPESDTEGNSESDAGDELPKDDLS